MRQIALDTETTGLDPKRDHRIVEIGCVELVDGRRSGQTFHHYVNPQRPVSADAIQIHGLDNQFLNAQKRFEEIAEPFLQFIGDDPLIIHNAEFDLAFIHAELARLNRAKLKNEIIDTLTIARERFPNQSNRLDALCQRFGIDLSQRQKHGALIDASLLAEIYIALSAGDQTSFSLDTKSQTPALAKPDQPALTRKPPEAAKPRLTQEEIAAHQSFIQSLAPKGKNPLWNEIS